MHADGDVVTNPSFHSVAIGERVIRVYGEAARRRETGVESDEDCFNGSPSLFTGQTRGKNRACVEAMGYTIVIPCGCSGRVRHE